MTFNPQIGDRCNWRVWSDVEPCTVVARTPQRVTVRVNKTRLSKPPVMAPGGFAAVVTSPAEWEVLDELEPSMQVFSLRRNGRWKLSGTDSNSPGNELREGWVKFYDYGF